MGRKALNLVQHHPFDAVLMDLHMPVMDGFESARRIRALPRPRRPADHRHDRRGDGQGSGRPAAAAGDERPHRQAHRPAGTGTRTLTALDSPDRLATHPTAARARRPGASWPATMKSKHWNTRCRASRCGKASCASGGNCRLYRILLRSFAPASRGNRRAPPPHV